MADDKNNLANLFAADAGGEGATGKSGKKERNLDLILDIPLRVTVELGRTKMVVNDLLNLGQGSVIELSKLAGEPMEVLVNDKLVARGEAVVVNEKFGVRLTDIISPAERVEQLK
jgi:flagellar motor switch protein FliN/FliY